MYEIAGDKVERIIQNEFDGRMAGAVVGYILDKGWENLQKVTEEDILEIKGNAMMTDVFVQALVRTAVKICKECNQWDDFFPFIINQLPVHKAQSYEIELDKEEVPSHVWKYLLRKLRLDYEDDVKYLSLNANVLYYE